VIPSRVWKRLARQLSPMVSRLSPALLRTSAEREMIATYVSSQNDCIYCQSCHGSTAAQHLGGSDADYELIAQIKQNYQATPISSKMKALLAIAGKVQKAANT
jgi:AhpD family alkylhydroperoxidase